MKEIRLAKKMFETLIRDRVQYPGRLFADTSSIVARCGVLIILYSYVFKVNGGVINGTTFNIVAWSIFFYFSFLMLGLRSISGRIMQDVVSGNVEVFLSKPAHYLLYRVWWAIGTGIYPFVVTTILGIVVLTLTIGIPQTIATTLFAQTFLVTFICSAVLMILVYSIVGLLAFWMEDIMPVYWIIDKSVMIFGGSYLPVALFPDLMYKVALYSPFGASVFVSHAAYESWATVWYKLIGIQVLWILVLGILALFMFSRASKKVSVNGG